MYKVMLIFVFIFCLCGRSFSQEEESLTITTYYPSPYGVYNQLQTEDLQVNNNITVNGLSYLKNEVRVQNAHDLRVENGDVYANNFVPNSSMTLKKDIQALTSAEYREILSKLVQTQVYHFRFRKQAQEGKLNIGLIAEKSPREIVSEDGKGVNLGEAVGFLLAAIKAQQEEINSLKKEINSLKANK